jgi:uncharacterized membrane protein YcaP (DUF421 family)
MASLTELGFAFLGLGREAMEISVPQMALRAAIVYVVALTIVRLGKKRFMGSSTAFDLIVGIILGSTMSRALTGNAPLLPSFAAAAVLVAMHWIVSELALRWHGFGALAKGKPRMLVRDGVPDRSALERSHITERDLEEALRGHGLADVSGVAEARLERDGSISVIKRSEPRIVEIDVAEGVQKVRIELG